jgi:thiol-disulfide isomerase/thioredoxin
MEIKTGLLFWGIFLASMNGMGQTKDAALIRAGQKVPNFELHIQKGKETQRSHLYDLNKPVIFDIWGVNCTSCIKSMPHILQLQQQLKDSVQIILVTRNTKEQVDSLWSKLKGHVPPSIIDAYRQLPSIVNDTSISFRFPVPGYPTHVWIDRLHSLKAVAYSSSTTLENLSAFARGQSVHLDEIALQSIDFTNPLAWLDKDTGFLHSLQYYSFIFSRINHAGRNDRLFFTKKEPSSNKITDVYCLNTPLTDLYKLAYFKYQSPTIQVGDHKILLEVADKGKFRWPMDYAKYSRWADTSLFCFAIKMPAGKEDSLYPMMQSTLDRYFNYSSSMQVRKVKCLVLKRVSAEDKLRARGTKTINEISITKKGSYLILKNQSIDALYSKLESLVWFKDSFQPIFNETGYTNNIDFTMPWSDDPEENSLEEIKKSLRQYGLDLVEEYKNLEMLVIRDRSE